MLRNTDGGGRVSSFPEKKHYEGVSFNVISVTRGWVGVQFPGKNRYVTLEWPLVLYLFLGLEEKGTLLWVMVTTTSTGRHSTQNTTVLTQSG